MAVLDARHPIGDGRGTADRERGWLDLASDECERACVGVGVGMGNPKNPPNVNKKSEKNVCDFINTGNSF